MRSKFTLTIPEASSLVQLEMETALTDAVGQLSPSSRRTYTIDARQFAGWMVDRGITPATMTRSHAIAYRSYLQEHYAKATAARKFVVARVRWSATPLLISRASLSRTRQHMWS
jgi:hypothetical protein